MFKLSDNYFQRKCYFKQEQVPTQSIMIDKMKPPLANVYFKSMRYKLKVLAGLEPPLKGGGSDWFVPPKDLLEEGRAALKPLKNEFLTKLGFNGIDFLGEEIVAHHLICMDNEKRNAILESDINWKNTITDSCKQRWDDVSKMSAKLNTQKIQQAFQEFTTLYSTSITYIENLLHDAAVEEINRFKKEAFDKMSLRLETLIKQQATELYDEYTDKLAKEKARLKALFIENLEQSRGATGEQLHDINVEKHLAIEKLRYYLECQNLACRIYVALKEREECEKEMKLSKYKHEKKMKVLKEEIFMKDFEISLAKEKERKRQEFNRFWQKKICEVVKKLQMFIAYSLNTLPEHAEFFINMEKLMMLQLNASMDNPTADNIFVVEDRFHTPVPRPHPFFLFCDKGYKPTVDQDLCPKHCTSSASQLPVIIVNKQCIYAACDNFETFTNKVKQYIYGKRGDDDDFVDDHDYVNDIPVKVTRSKELEEIKLESSLLQILQKEHPNLKKLKTECCICRIPHCFCSRLQAEEMSTERISRPLNTISLHSLPSGNKIETRDDELKHERQPKWESYIEYREPKRCKCPRTAKKNLQEHLPAYMRNMSSFESPELPHYQPCSLTMLRKLVSKAQGKRPPPEPVIVESKTRDMCTQYSDQAFDMLCNCFSDDEVDKLYSQLLNNARSGNFKIVDGSYTPSSMSRDSGNFATERAYSLRNLLAASPELEEIFRMKDCTF